MEDVILKAWLALGVIVVVGLGLLLVAAQAQVDEWNTTVSINRMDACERNRKLLRRDGPKALGGISYRMITATEMVECGWEPYPNDVCVSQADCEKKAAFERKNAR